MNDVLWTEIHSVEYGRNRDCELKRQMRRLKEKRGRNSEIWVGRQEGNYVGTITTTRVYIP